MSFDRKLNINKNIISIILTSFFSFIIFFSNESIYVKKVERLIIDIYSTLSYPTTWYGNILSIKEENSVLSQKIVQISLMNAKLENYKIENDNLRNMLKFKESYKYLSLLPANIVNNHYSISSKSCIINAGSNEKINNNLAVIDMYGNLMGKIISTAENNSKVQLLTDNNFSVSIKLNDNSLAQFKPTHGRYGILEGTLKTLNIKKGDIIYTSGISEIYPSDIPVARVLESSKDERKMFQEVLVEILIDLNSLLYVFVIQ